MNIVTAILSYHHVPSGKKEDLVAAIKPKVIICLGKITFEMVSHKVTKAFLEKLKKGEPWVEKYPSDSDIYIYGILLSCLKYTISPCRKSDLELKKPDPLFPIIDSLICLISAPGFYYIASTISCLSFSPYYGFLQCFHIFGFDFYRLSFP